MMIPRRLAAALAGVALVAGLSGCATPALDDAAAAQFQESVVAIADSAAAGDLAGAVGGLDELQTELDAAIEADLVTAARAARIQAAIDAVRSDLDMRSRPRRPWRRPHRSSPPIRPARRARPAPGAAGTRTAAPGNNNGNGEAATTATATATGTGRRPADLHA